MDVRIRRAFGLAFGMGLAVSLCSCSRDETVQEESPVESSSKMPVAWIAKPKKNPTMPKSKRITSVTDVDERTDLAPTDRETLKIVEKAMEGDDIKCLRTAARAAAESQSTEVRSEMVDALGWFGVEAMDDLLPFMADADADIAESALNNWTTALGEIEDEKRKCAMVEGVMRALKNEEALESLVMEINDCEEILTLQAVVNLIQCDNPVAVKVAREHYEFMTGEEFTTLEAANAWAVENCSDDTES